MKILVYSQLFKEEDRVYVEEFLHIIQGEMVELSIFSEYARQLESSGISTDGIDKVSSNAEMMHNLPDMIVTLGGDGTILSVIDLVRDSNVPILGINLGRLGFLSSVEKSKIKKAIKSIIKNDYYTEQRTILKLDCDLPLFGALPYALNDFTLHKRDTSSMVTIHAYIDGKFLNSYWADGIVVATPTGSTGYSLSCGGPIIFPGSGNFVITPVAPHNLNVRPVVISDGKQITFEIEGRSENFLCTLDSRYETITSEHVIQISKGEFHIKLAHLQDVDFMKTIRGKLMWGLDSRNH